MMEKREGGCSRRERLEVMATALVPAALGKAAPATILAGRLSWLAPALALPVGLGLCPVWERLGKRDLSRGLEEAFGKAGGGVTAWLYLLWALVLLADAARRYSERLLTVSEGEGARWLFLLSALGLCLWLGRGCGERFARAGRLLFLAVGATLGAVLLLALPGIDGQNLWPPEGADWRQLPGAGALCLSLGGYGIYALCLPRREEDEAKRVWPWAAGGGAVLAALLFIVVGTFGPTLTGGMREPFLFLLEGVQVPGAFRRGEAGLIAVLALADLVLLTLLGRGATALWQRLIPVFPGLGWIPVTAAFALAGILPGLEQGWAWLAAAVPAGNLIFGVLLPVLSVLTIQARERKKRRTTCSGRDDKGEADVAVKPDGKKSGGENEKKC